MKYVNLGRSGLKVSRLCLGCMRRPSFRGATHPIPGFSPARPFLSLLTIA